VSRKKGKSQQRQKAWRDYLHDEDAPVSRQKSTKAVKLPPWRQATIDANIQDLPRVEGMVVGLFPSGVMVRVTGEQLLCGIAGTFRPPGAGPDDPAPASTALAVGDEVTVALTNAVSSAGDRPDKLRADGMIIARRVRRTVLARPMPRSAKRNDPYADERLGKVVAANMDQLVVVMAVRQPALSKMLIDRFLIIAEKGEMASLIVINKIDLAAPDEALLNDLRSLGAETLLASATTGVGIDLLRQRLAGKRSILAGPSGVGKSTLINALIPGSDAAVGAIRMKDRRGRHTTAASKISTMPPPDVQPPGDGGGDQGASPGVLVDTPGIRELGVDMGSAELPWYFPEFEAFAPQCKFRDCTHTHEPHCAVVSAVAEGKIKPQRYESYLRILQTITER
jgi:ribosome biogenesis GTPase